MNWTTTKSTGRMMQMPQGPKSQKRPGDVIGAADMVTKITTGGHPGREHEVTLFDGGHCGVDRGV